ncbi:MAG: hypothetical protein DRI61_14745 [Chloroflexi bacterium]|nr:MAG: hypothetical protein DRI61_14745 [Chloroflexota bacterium]
MAHVLLFLFSKMHSWANINILRRGVSKSGQVSFLIHAEPPRLDSVDVVTVPNIRVETHLNGSAW